jgi:hypothetical protein
LVVEAAANHVPAPLPPPTPTENFNIIFIYKFLSLFRFIVFLLFLIFDIGIQIPSWRNLHRRVAIIRIQHPAAISMSLRRKVSHSSYFFCFYITVNMFFTSFIDIVILSFELVFKVF